MTRLRPAALLTLGLAPAIFAGCTVLRAPGDGAPRRGPGAAIEWPIENPRIRLERVIAFRSDAGEKGFLARVAGRARQPLFVRPFGVAWRGDDLLVTDPGAGRVLRLSEAGGVLTSAAGAFSEPIGIASCGDGIVVTDSLAGTVVQLDEQLRVTRTIGRDLKRPTGVACSGRDIYVVETAAHRLLRIGEDGARVDLGARGTAPGEFNFPTAVTFGAGFLWVVDTLNFRIQRFEPSPLRFTGEFGRIGDAAGEMPRGKGLAIDAGGIVWLSDAYLDQLALYTAEGQFLADVGRNGSGPGEFAFPAGLAAHADGRVAVVDSLNRRLQLLRRLDIRGDPQ